MSKNTQRRLAASIAANESWAKTPDRSARTAPARAALMAKFENQADPDGVLLPAERARRAESLRKAHFQRLALRSVKARQARAAAGAELRSVDGELSALGVSTEAGAK